MTIDLLTAITIATVALGLNALFLFTLITIGFTMSDQYTEIKAEVATLQAKADAEKLQVAEGFAGLHAKIDELEGKIANVLTDVEAADLIADIRGAANEIENIFVPPTDDETGETEPTDG